MGPIQMNANRLYFLDWLRIIAVVLLVVFHTGKYYSPLPWHILSPYASSDVVPFMMMTGPWRLALLFLISGVASAYLLEKNKPMPFIRQRSSRLLIPLAIGVFLIIPPQSYFEVIDKFNYNGTYFEFLALYLSGYDRFCSSEGKCLFMPDWNHLWFLGYLWVYSAVLACVAWRCSLHISYIGERLAGFLIGWRAIVLPAGFLALMRIVFSSAAVSGTPIIASVFYHANYFVLFVAGVLLARQAGFWHVAEMQRWVALGIAVSCWAVRLVYFSFLASAPSTEWTELLRYGELAVFGVCTWSAILAACGFARRHLNRDHASRRYMIHAVFPFYIVHQTLIIALAFNLRPFKLPPAIEAPLIIASTLLVCFIWFEIARRISFLRPVFGLSAAAAPAVPLVATPAVRCRPLTLPDAAAMPSSPTSLPQRQSVLRKPGS